MRTAVRELSSRDGLTARQTAVTPRHPQISKVASVFSRGMPMIQRDSFCACDGGCPACSQTIQPKLTAEQPDDGFQQEVDREADQEMYTLGPEPSPKEPPASVVHDRIDVRAQFAFQRLFKSKSPADRNDAIELFYRVDSGEIRGIYGDDLGIAAQLAKKRNTVRWKLHLIGEPKGGDAVWIEDDAPDAETDTPVIIFRESAGKKPRLDQALLLVYRIQKKKNLPPPPPPPPNYKKPPPQKKTPVFKPPTKEISPHAHMKGDFQFGPWSEKSNIFLGLPSIKAGIKFDATVGGLTGTRGWVFFVQNIMEILNKVRFRRGTQTKNCQLHETRQGLDTQYPYDRIYMARFTGEDLKIVFLETSDGPVSYGKACESPYQVGDIMELEVLEKFRMFLVWDPYAVKKPRSAKGAHPVSLGFVEWGFKGAGTFVMSQLHPSEYIWKKKQLGGDPIGGGNMTRTPSGAYIEIDFVITGDDLGERLEEDCCKNKILDNA